MPRRYPVIFNPKARSQKSGKVRRFLEEHEKRFSMHATQCAGDARDIAARLARDGESVVIAAGGDGTLNEVVQGLAGTQSILGVLPAGTMNVFAREMGIPYTSLDKALEVIDAGLIREVDLFELNGSPFIQMAGVGFDAKVIEETSWESKKKLGPLAYLLAAVKVLGEKPPEMEVVTSDGRRETGVAVLAGNGSLYGGQFKVFRKADNQDSMIDVLVYKEAGYKLVLDSLRGLTFGNFDLMASTAYFQAESFTVTANREVPMEVDGELAGRSTQFEFKETPNRLRVLAPDGPLGGSFAETLKSFFQWPKREPEAQPSSSKS
ncbi:MAG: diacylglycerol kinase family lipid kinase [Akkermansiaceae bacterium]|nr:diacylglycerol kinase family lipid kinase [Akkermansiaceae bacterium]